MSAPKKTWAERIDAAEKRGGFTLEDSELAAAWATCACGQLDFGIPRRSNGAPVDQLLYDFGSMFYDAVENDFYRNARSLIDAIDARAGEVLRAQVGGNRN